MMTFLKVGLVAVVLFVLVKACNNLIDPSKVESGMNGSWVALETLNGTGDVATSAYNVSTGKVRVRWFARNTEKSEGMFKVRAKNPTTGRLINNIADVTVGAGGVRNGERAFQNAQQFYLEIQSNSSWEITMETMQ